MKSNVSQIILYLFIAAGLFAMIAGLLVISHPSIEKMVETRLLEWSNKQPPAPHYLPPRWEGKVRVLGFETLVLGVLIVFIAFMFLKKCELCNRWAENDRYLLLSAMVLMTLIWLPIALWGHSAVIFGKRVWFLGDDPMISMRYAKNLAQGNGWVWNPGERIEGYSNPLWTLVMAGCHILPISERHVSLIILLINFLISLWILFLLHRLLSVLRKKEWVKAGVLFAYVLNRDLLAVTMAGFEIPLLIAFMVWAMVRILKESGSAKPKLFTAILIGIIALIRSDAFILSLLLMIFSLALHPKRKAVLIQMSLAILIPVIHLVFRKIYYHDWLPNTAYLKIEAWHDRWTSGMRYAFGFLKQYFIPIIAALFGLSFTRKKVNFLLMGFILLFIIYVIYVGGDAFHHFRFFLPILPLIFIMAFIGIQKLQLNKAFHGPVTLIVLVTLPLVSPGYTLSILIPRPADIYNVELGLWIKTNTSSNVRIADSWAGNTFYFSDRYGIDLLGKNDRIIARMPVSNESAKVGHNKFNYDYSLGELKPDYVVSNFKLPINEKEIQRHMTGDWAAAGALYFHPLFQAHCLSYPVHVDTWRTIFACDWSEELNRRNKVWKTPSW